MLPLEVIIGQRGMGDLEVEVEVLGLQVMEEVIMVDLKFNMMVIQLLVVRVVDLIIQDQVRIIRY